MISSCVLETAENLLPDGVEGQAIESTQFLHIPFCIIRGTVIVPVLLRIQIHPRNRPAVYMGCRCDGR